MLVDTLPTLTLVEDATQALLDWAADVTESDATLFQKAKTLATRLGAHYQADGLTEIGFWTPELTSEVIQSDRSIYLEVFTPIDPINFRAPKQLTRWRREHVSLAHQGEYIWGVVRGMRPGTREQAGSFYWLRYVDRHNQLHTLRDVLAYSMPYGIFAPAELYDMERVQRQRADLAYFCQTGAQTAALPGQLASEVEQVPPRLPAPHCILQVHISTASAAGTMEGLTQIYRQMAQKLRQDEPLTLAEQNYLGYDAIQLLPIEPTVEYRWNENNVAYDFFALWAGHTDGNHGDLPDEPQDVPITLRKPTTQNWGYDVPILGSAAINPALLGSLRPDELIDLIVELHTFPQGPIQLIYDLVYGHADNQCQFLISPPFLKGPNMYGQDLNHQHPGVRGILLEMQRRKLNTGADGIRVDGGQDFRFFNPLTGIVEQDDAYLLAMGDVIQDIGGYQRLMFTIFEDGRPWPQEGWEEISRYRELIELRPEAYQWGPLIFAHNTPVLKQFWDQKWRRVCEVMSQGDHWITGCANHDTVRRGNQIDPAGPINGYLGDTLEAVIKKAYDNPATKLWVYGFSPGLPMDFLNATFRGAWGFFRNSDERYGVKVVSEEAGFLDWQVTPDHYASDHHFRRLKAMGFVDLDPLRRFVEALQSTMVDSDYDLEQVAETCRRCFDGEGMVCANPRLQQAKDADVRLTFWEQLDVAKLKDFAKAFMEDCHDFAKVDYWAAHLQPAQVEFNRALRHYRSTHPWLRENLGERDRFNRISDEDRTLFYGLRTPPSGDSAETLPAIAMVTHMGGPPLTVTLADWLQLDLTEWRVALQTPGLNLDNDVDSLRAFELQDSQGVLLEKIREMG